MWFSRPQTVLTVGYEPELQRGSWPWHSPCNPDDCLGPGARMFRKAGYMHSRNREEHRAGQDFRGY